MSNTQRFRTISYATLDDKFTDQTCTVANIDLPDLQRSKIYGVHLTQEKAPQYFHTAERKEIVKFSVTYIPLDNDQGKALLPYVKEVISSVLQNNYQPQPATINLIRNGEIEETVTINDCIISRGEILLDKGNYIRIKFDIQGLISKDY